MTNPDSEYSSETDDSYDEDFDSEEENDDANKNWSAIDMFTKLDETLEDKPFEPTEPLLCTTDENESNTTSKEGDTTTSKESSENTEECKLEKASPNTTSTPPIPKDKEESKKEDNTPETSKEEKARENSAKEKELEKDVVGNKKKEKESKVKEKASKTIKPIQKEAEEVVASSDDEETTDSKLKNSSESGKMKKNKKFKKAVDVTLLDAPEQILPPSNDLERETIANTPVSSPPVAVPASARADFKENRRKSFLFQRLAGSTKKKEKTGKMEQKVAATKIQSLWKGHKLRKKLAVAGPLKVALKQLHTLQDIVKVEKEYIGHLRTIIDNYLRPLISFNKFNEEARKALPIQVIKAIFRNVEKIYNLHVGLLKQLNERVEAWPFVTDIPPFLLKAIGSFNIYAPFAEEAASAEETLRFFQQKPPLSTFLTKMYDERLQLAGDPNATLPGLYPLLVLPFKHLGKLYRCYSQFMYETPSTYPDYQLLANAVAIINQLKSYIWETANVGIRKRDMTILAKKIQSANGNTSRTVSKPRVIALNPNQPISNEELIVKTVKSKKKKKSSSKKKRKKDSAAPTGNAATPTTSLGNDKSVHFDVMAPNRKLIRSGTLLVGSQLRHVSLFNDVCLVLEVIAAHNCRFDAIFDLKDAVVHSKSPSLDTFRVKADRGDFIFAEKIHSIESEENSWAQSFEEAIALCDDNVYGVPLEVVVEREQAAIPSVVLHAVQELNKSIAEPTLFQRAKHVQTLRKLNNNETTHVERLVFYLEQLPDILFQYERQDKVLSAQSIPDEAILLGWVRKKLSDMPIYSKNLLEYIMTFLSKVLARTALNGLSSEDLAVTFSPLIFRPEALTLAYCYRVPRIVCLVRIMIERAGELFMTADDETPFPLPASLEEFFVAYQFGQWWRDLRHKKDYFIQFIATEEKIGELVAYILAIPNAEETEEEKKSAQFSTLAYGILVNDGVIDAMFQNTKLLSAVIGEFNGQNVSEKANKHFCDFIDVLLRGNQEKMQSYLAENREMNRKIVGSIGSGNFCNTILTVAETWQMSKTIHKIIVGWGVLALEQLIEGEESPESDQLSSTVRFLRFLVRTSTFIGSPTSAPFVSMLQSKEYAHKIIKKAIQDGTCETRVSTIPLVIEILVQNKNKTPGRSPLDSIILRAPSDLSEEESEKFEKEGKQAYHTLQQQLKKDVPPIVLALFENQELLQAQMKIPLEEKQKNLPLGFFRLQLIKLVQATLVTNYPYGNSFVAHTELIGTCLQLFFYYHKHSILHSVIAYIVRYIMAMGNRDLVEELLIHLDLPGKIAQVFTGENKEQLEYLRGYLKMLSIAIRNSAIAEQLLRDHEEWNNYVNYILLQEDAPVGDSSTNKQVALAQKKIARSNLTKKEFVDEMEDKIS